MSGELDCDTLTDKQFWLAGFCAAKGHPHIIDNAGEARVASTLAKLGWGSVEDGASGQRIFRLSQAGEDAFAWVRSWRAA